MHLRPPRSRTGTIMRSREGGMQRGDRPGEGDAESLELPDVNTCRLVSCVNALHFNPATAVCMQRAHWVARAACVVGADTAHTESFRLWRNNRIAPLIRLVRGPALSKTQVAETQLIQICGARVVDAMSPDVALASGRSGRLFGLAAYTCERSNSPATPICHYRNMCDVTLPL